MNALEERLSKTVCHYSHLYDSLHLALLYVGRFLASLPSSVAVQTEDYKLSYTLVCFEHMPTLRVKL